MQRLFRQFSTPGGIPSHVSAPTPGLHPRGRRARLRAHPRLRRGVRQPGPDRRRGGRRRRGRDRSARGLVEGHQLPQPGARRRGAARSSTSTATRSPAPPCSAARPTTRSARCSRATATRSTSSRATTRRACTRRSPPRSTAAYERIRAHPARGPRSSGVDGTARAGRRIVLRTPKGWTGPEGGRRRADRGDLPRPPGAAGRRARRTRSTSRCSRPGCAATARRSSSTRTAGSSPSWPRSPPTGDRRMGANPQANGGTAAQSTSTCPTSRDYAVTVEPPATEHARVHPPARRAAARRLPRERRQANFRLFCPDETNSNRLGAVFEVENRCFVEPTLDIDDHVVARRPGDGGAERAPLRGLARGLPPHRPARPVRHLRGLRDGRRPRWPCSTPSGSRRR